MAGWSGDGAGGVNTPAIARESALSDRNAVFPGDPVGSWSPNEVIRRVLEAEKTATAVKGQYADELLDSGDGIVFLGEYGPWYSPDNNQFHLTHPEAKKLLEGVLKTYSDEDGKPLKEIFLHCRSSISREEFAGYQEACPAGCKLVGIRVRSDSYGPRLFRDGAMPVIRGTFLKTSNRSGFLYAAGFKPRLGTYDGWETPVPLRIDIQHGESEIELVATDILGLTKLNTTPAGSVRASPCRSSLQTPWARF